MRRVTKNFLISTAGVLFTYFYCEYLIYYISIFQCAWPLINAPNENLKALIIADMHLLGPRKSRWLDRWRRESQMQQAFRAILTIHDPDVVFVLGDLFDEGELSNEKQFVDYVARFFKIFAVPNATSMYVVAGNHDVGFHNFMRRNSSERFARLLNSPPVQLITLKGNHFVLIIINSMALKGDSCRLCTTARNYIEKLPVYRIIKYQLGVIAVHHRIIVAPLLCRFHFPLYRESDALCTSPDEVAPLSPNRKIPFRKSYDSLSPEATEYIISMIKPRAVFGGHTHHGCLIRHKYDKDKIEFDEYSVASFSWRYRPDPKYLLVTVSPFDYAATVCGLPLETTVAMTAGLLLFLLIFFMFKWRIGVN